MGDSAGDLIWIGLAWIAYFVLHSVFASLRAKRWIAQSHPAARPYYRIGFNLAALLLLIPVAALVYSAPGPWLWRWTGPFAWLALGLRLAAALGFAASLRSYDLSAFLGFRQLNGGHRSADDAEALHISTLHRYVRHPWYFLLLVVVWSGDMNQALLLSAALITGYLIVGARLEERKLLLSYGDAYADYMASVGGLLPRPWKVLSPQKAAEIKARAAANA